MASTTYTKIEKPSSEQDANKVVTLNVGTDDIDVMVGGFLSISVAGSSNVTLTRAQALNAVLKFTGALTGNIIIYIPVIANAAITPPTTTIGAIREYTVWNATTGAFSLTVKTSAVASAGVAVTQGTKSLLAHDGTDVFAVVAGGGGGLGYAVRYMTITALTAPADASTYYAGLPIASGYGLQGTHDIARIPVVKAGTITAVTIRVIVDGTLASAENVAISLRLNNTTDTSLTATSQWTARVVDHLVTGLSIAVVAGDFIIIKVVTPTWATNPTDVSIAGDIYIE